MFYFIFSRHLSASFCFFFESSQQINQMLNKNVVDDCFTTQVETYNALTSTSQNLIDH